MRWKVIHKITQNVLVFLTLNFSGFFPGKEHFFAIAANQFKSFVI